MGAPLCLQSRNERSISLTVGPEVLNFNARLDIEAIWSDLKRFSLGMHLVISTRLACESIHIAFWKIVASGNWMEVGVCWKRDFLCWHFVTIVRWPEVWAYINMCAFSLTIIMSKVLSLSRSKPILRPRGCLALESQPSEDQAPAMIYTRATKLTARLLFSYNRVFIHSRLRHAIWLCLSIYMQDHPIHLIHVL